MKRDETARALLASMFCLGVFSLLAQVLFMREMLVVFRGNEMVIGVLLACWLIHIGLGAYGGKRALCVLRSPGAIRLLLATLLTATGGVFPFQVYAIRVVRSILDVGVGSYASLGNVFACSLAIFAPSCLVTGFVFPVVCHLMTLGRSESCAGDVGAASRTYTLEALGSMVAGVALTYVLLPLLSPSRLVVLCMSVPMAGAACLAGKGTGRRVMVGVCVILGGAAMVWPPSLQRLERAAVTARWEASGLLGTRRGAGHTRLVEWDDTVYQNLTLTESYGQYALYSNGQLLFVFPDPVETEHDVHFVMAQKPRARRVLVLGGNPAGGLRELLRYPLERLVYVELDPGIPRLVNRYTAGAVDRLRDDPRLELVTDDAQRYLDACREEFDVILVNAPEPVTAAANRFYTVEFYRSARRVLAADGFLYTAVSSAVRLRSAAVDLSASIYRALRHVFPRVLVTAEERHRFFAGHAAAGEGAGLTFDRRELFRRSRDAELETEYFRPEFFLTTDGIEPSKTRYVEQRFMQTEAKANRRLRPVTFFYALMLWSRYSGSGLEAVLESASRMRWWPLCALLVGSGAVLAAAGWLSRMLLPDGAARSYARCLTALLLASTGFCGMALEIALVFLFQSYHGCLYTHMGLLVAAFMAGLVSGAPCGRRLARGSGGKAWMFMAGLETGIMALAILIPLAASAGEGSGLWQGYPVALIVVLTMFSGWTVGAEFPLGNRLYRDSGGSAGAAAGVADAADHLGAATGALFMAVILVPILGIAGACLVLGGLKVCGLFLLLGVRMAMSRLQG